MQKPPPTAPPLPRPPSRPRLALRVLHSLRTLRAACVGIGSRFGARAPRLVIDPADLARDPPAPGRSRIVLGTARVIILPRPDP